eukprot:15435321-Alexandrium_andersonii.AAC.1
MLHALGRLNVGMGSLRGVIDVVKVDGALLGWMRNPQEHCMGRVSAYFRLLLHSGAQRASRHWITVAGGSDARSKHKYPHACSLPC